MISKRNLYENAIDENVQEIDEEVKLTDIISLMTPAFWMLLHSITLLLDYSYLILLGLLFMVSVLYFRLAEMT